MFTEPLLPSPRTVAPKRRLQLLRIAEALSKLHRQRVRLMFYQRWRLYVVAKALSGIRFQMLSCRQPESMRTNGGGPLMATLILKTGKKATTKKRVCSTTRIFSSAMGTPPQSPSSISASLGALSGNNNPAGGPPAWPTANDAALVRFNKDREVGGLSVGGSGNSSISKPTGSPQYEGLLPTRSTTTEEWRDLSCASAIPSSSSSSAASVLFKEVLSLRGVVESQKRSIDMRDRLINELSRERDSLIATVDRVTQQQQQQQQQHQRPPRGEFELAVPTVTVAVPSHGSMRLLPTSIPSTPESPSVCDSAQPPDQTPQNPPSVQAPSSRTPLPLWLESSSDPAVEQSAPQPSPSSAAACVTPAPPPPSTTSQSPAFTMVAPTSRLRNIAAACEDSGPSIAMRRRTSVDVAPTDNSDNAARSKEASSVDQDTHPIIPTSRAVTTGFSASPPVLPASSSTPRVGAQPMLISPPAGTTLHTSASVLNARASASLTISAFVHNIKSQGTSCSSSSNGSAGATSSATSLSGGEGGTPVTGRAAAGLVQVISSANRKHIAAVRGTSLLPSSLTTMPQKASVTTPK